MHAPHVTRHTSHVTRHTSHVTRHTSHATRHTSHATRHPLQLHQPPRPFARVPRNSRPRRSPRQSTRAHFPGNPNLIQPPVLRPLRRFHHALTPQRAGVRRLASASPLRQVFYPLHLLERPVAVHDGSAVRARSRRRRVRPARSVSPHRLLIPTPPQYLTPLL